jgi:hypothetical protein
MRHKHLYIYYILSVILLCANFYPVLAKAPITAKIVFASGRDGNREIYLMNPDGTQQVNISDLSKTESFSNLRINYCERNINTLQVR